jgi:hypothetical protein
MKVEQLGQADQDYLVSPAAAVSAPELVKGAYRLLRCRLVGMHSDY